MAVIEMTADVRVVAVAEDRVIISGRSNAALGLAIAVLASVVNN